MEVVYERCCGLDVHKKSVVACLRTSEGAQLHAFRTVTRGLLQLLDWLQEERVTNLAMESTGVYWKPVYNLLEGQGIEQIVVNPRDIKAVPGRKTDVKDAEWIANLLRHGLLQGSRIFERPQRELQEAVRYRKSLVEARSDEVKRLQKVLEGANIKLSDVATDVVGKSGRTMIRALIDGYGDSTGLAQMARGRMRAKREDLELALEGSVGPHQRFMLDALLQHIEFLEHQIEQMNNEISSRLRPQQEHQKALQTVTGVGTRVAQVFLAEAGSDMSYWPTDKHFASWARLCPGNNQSAGKRRPSSIGHGNDALRCAMVEAANAATRVKDSYFAALYARVKARRGHKRAKIAVAHAILVTMYHVLKDGTVFQDLGADYFDHIDRKAIVRRSVHRLERLGYTVTVEEQPSAA